MKPLILMYHRIADEPVDYWGLAVSPNRFEEQLCVLRRTRRPLPLPEFARKLAIGTLPPDAVALTFDDGYVDNLIAGLPRLTAADVPATVFLATGYVDRREPFWWDELAEFILPERGPMRLEIEIKGKPMFFDLGSALAAGEGRAIPSAVKNPHDILEAIYHPIRFLHDEERRAAMLKLRSSFAECTDSASLPRAMTSEELRTLVSGGLVTIGAHTVTHPSLPGLGVDVCRYEVTESKRACEALVGGPVTAFAYPYGEYDAEAREAVISAGFAFACATRRGPAVTASEVFDLPRIYIPDLDGAAFEQRLQWASSLA